MSLQSHAYEIVTPKFTVVIYAYSPLLALSKFYKEHGVIQVIDVTDKTFYEDQRNFPFLASDIKGS